MLRDGACLAVIAISEVALQGTTAALGNASIDATAVHAFASLDRGDDSEESKEVGELHSGKVRVCWGGLKYLNVLNVDGVMVGGKDVKKEFIYTRD